MPQLDFRQPRLFVDAAMAAGETVALERSQSNYLGNVLRLSEGDTILVFNGRDGEWQASIGGRKRPDRLRIVTQTRPQDRLPDLAYVFAPLKHARLDYMVQKAVEMGASTLQPVVTRFTQVARVNGERMRANVSGRITIHGKGKGGVAVGLRPQQFGPQQGPIFKATSDPDGNYRIADVPAGNYLIGPIAPAFVAPDMTSFGP